MRVLPLRGTTVIEFDAIGPVPFAGMLLSDLGADVVRVTRPGRAPSRSADGPVMGRGRRSVELDLRSEMGVATALELVAGADALIEGSRPGVMEKLGLGPETCMQANPRLAYGRMTGWGQEGPLSLTAGHDINFLALSGALHAIGPAERPVPPLNLVADYGGGAMMLVSGVLATIIGARMSGVGGVIDTAMVDGAALLSTLVHVLHADGGWEDRRASNLLDGGAPFYCCYRCADGSHVAVGAIERPFFLALVEGLGLTQWRDSQDDRSAWPDMAVAFTAVFASRSRDEWTGVFDGTDACVTPVLSLTEAPAHPHNVERATFARIGEVWYPAPAPRVSMQIHKGEAGD